MLELLRCPETRQRLEHVSREVLARLLAARSAGTLRTRAGAVPEPFEGALATLDGSRIYPIRGGIPVMLAEEAL
jgi:uncharacterized protein